MLADEAGGGVHLVHADGELAAARGHGHRGRLHLARAQPQQLARHRRLHGPHRRPLVLPQATCLETSECFLLPPLKLTHKAPHANLRQLCWAERLCLAGMPDRHSQKGADLPGARLAGSEMEAG